MDEEKNNIEGERKENNIETSNSNTSYRPVKQFTVNNKKESFNIGRKIITPFIFGSLGAALVVGICFGIPNIKNTIIGSSNSSNNSDFTTFTNTSNTNLINLSEYSNTSVGVADKVLPSVVGIKVEFPVNSIFSRNSSTASASGSGIIISEDGYILTNNHIVDSSTTNSSSFSFYEVGEASKVEVYLYNDKNPYVATIVGTDKQTDLAVIKIDKTGLKSAEIGDSDSLKVGEFAMTIGNPLGFESSVCTGS